MFENFQSFLPKTIKSLNLEKQTTASHVIFLAQELILDINQKLTNNFKIISFKNNIIKIYCKHPIVAQEILSNQENIITQINSKLKHEVVKKISTTTQIENIPN